MRRVAADLAGGLPFARRRSVRPDPGYVRQKEAWRTYDCAGRLAEIRVPTLVLHARHDRVVPYRRAVEMNAGIRGSRIVAFEGDHLFFLGAGRQRVASAAREALTW